MSFFVDFQHVLFQLKLNSKSSVTHFHFTVLAKSTAGWPWIFVAFVIFWNWRLYCHLSKLKMPFSSKNLFTVIILEGNHRLYWIIFERSTLVGQRPMKSLSSVCPSVLPSVTKLSQDWIISFFWYCAWWLLTIISSDWRSQIFEKKWKIGDRNFGQMGQNRTQN